MGRMVWWLRGELTGLERCGWVRRKQSSYWTVLLMRVGEGVVCGNGGNRGELGLTGGQDRSGSGAGASRCSWAVG